MSRKYLNNAWLLPILKTGVGKSYVSRGNLNSLTTDATLLITLVSYIGALFHAYWDVFEFWINTLWLPPYCPAIACVLFKNCWYFLTLFTLWLLCDRYHNSKAPRNCLYASSTTTDTMPNYNTTSSIINLDSDYALVSVVIDDTTNCVRSYIALSRWNPSWLLFSVVPGDHMPRWTI